MSFRYGLNGNNLRWDYMPATWTCVDCDAATRDARKAGESIDLDSWECDGHTHKYTFGRGYGHVLHDTNGNFVKVRGNVPLAVYNTEYLAERAAADYDGESMQKRILRELADESRISDGVGGWCNNNFGGDTCLYVDDMRAVVRLQSGKVFVGDVEIFYQDGDGNDGDEICRSYVQTPNGTQLYFDECMRFDRYDGRRTA